MGILERITADVQAAMKARDKDRLNVLRMVLSELKYVRTSTEAGGTLSEDTEIKAVQSYYKRLQKSQDEFPDAEQKARIGLEMKIVEEYLPKKIGEADVVKAVDELLATTSDRQFGNLMKQMMAKFGAAADGKVISKVLKEKLQ